VTPRFISHTIALAIHEDQINTFGGLHGMRDPSLFDSALAQPQMQFGEM
jgi:death-on-curing protein